MESAFCERLKELFDYNSDTGALYRKVSYGKSLQGFEFTGQSILVDGRWIRSTHIMWLVYYRKPVPDGYWIDHINGVKADNRICNLRLATPTQNQQNKAGSGTYPKGVTWRNRYTKPWQAKIRVNGERLHLGSFATMEEAATAYQEAAAKYHGEFAWQW